MYYSSSCCDKYGAEATQDRRGEVLLTVQGLECISRQRKLSGGIWSMVAGAHWCSCCVRKQRAGARSVWATTLKSFPSWTQWAHAHIHTVTLYGAHHKSMINNCYCHSWAFREVSFWCWIPSFSEWRQEYDCPCTVSVHIQSVFYPKASSPIIFNNNPIIQSNTCIYCNIELKFIDWTIWSFQSPYWYQNEFLELRIWL